MTAREEREACLVCRNPIIGASLRWEGIQPLCQKCKDSYDDFCGQESTTGSTVGERVQASHGTGE